MQLSSRKNRGAPLDINMTPMIDVVFLLLIFFMATSSFVRNERELDPGIKVNKQGTAAQKSFEAVIVDVLRLDARFVFRLGSREMASAAELQRVLQRLENKNDGAFVRASDDAPFDMAAAAIQACKSAGFATVSYVPLSK